MTKYIKNLKMRLKMLGRDKWRRDFVERREVILFLVAGGGGRNPKIADLQDCRSAIFGTQPSINQTLRRH